MMQLLIVQAASKKEAIYAIHVFLSKEARRFPSVLTWEVGGRYSGSLRSQDNPDNMPRSTSAESPDVLPLASCLPAVRSLQLPDRHLLWEKLRGRLGDVLEYEHFTDEDALRLIFIQLSYFEEIRKDCWHPASSVFSIKENSHWPQVWHRSDLWVIVTDIIMEVQYEDNLDP